MIDDQIKKALDDNPHVSALFRSAGPVTIFAISIGLAMRDLPDEPEIVTVNLPLRMPKPVADDILMYKRKREDALAYCLGEIVAKGALATLEDLDPELVDLLLKSATYIHGIIKENGGE